MNLSLARELALEIADADVLGRWSTTRGSVAPNRRLALALRHSNYCALRADLPLRSLVTNMGFTAQPKVQT